MARRRPRRIPPEVYQEIHRMVLEGGITNATEVFRILEQKFPDKCPSERTVRNVVRELMPMDPSGPWRPGPDEDPEEAARVLSAWADTLVRTKGEPHWRPLSRDRARWIAWILTGWPDLDPVVAVVLGTDYWGRQRSGRDTQDLDAFLAFAPWRSPEAWQRFQQVTQAGRVPNPPRWYWTAAMAQAMKMVLQPEPDLLPPAAPHQEGDEE